MIQLTFMRAVEESPTVKTFFFKPERPLDHQAGQFIELYLPHKKPDDKGQTRQFTLSSSPTENHIAITVKLPVPLSSYKQALERLTPGDVALTSDPMGDFVLPLDDSIPLIWIAGGIGITPFRSQAVWLADQGEKRSILVIHSTRSEDERLFTSQLERASPVVIEHIATSKDIKNGRIDALKVLQLIQPPAAPRAFASDKASFYISGPESLVEALAQDLHNSGIERERIVTDAFLGYRV